METLVANFSGKTRRESLNGREYLVAPMTLIVPGVLNGSKGPLYYPKDEIARNVGSWNHVPIVVYHPTRNGSPISARDPEVLNSQGVGFVFRSKANGKLTAEAWLDLQALARVDNRVLQNLEQGKPIELSTGLHTDNEPVGQGSTFNGKEYSFIARNYRPDHLAILPDQVGACSLQDGCGVLVNKDKSESPQQVVETNSVPLATEEKSMAKKELVDELIANCSCWTEEDREVLNNLEDSKIQSFIEAAKKSKADGLVANAAREGFEDHSGNQVAFDDKKGRWNYSIQKPEAKGDPVVNSQPTEPSPKSEAKQVKPQTDEEWLATAPAGIRSAVQNAINIEAQQRAKLIEQIVANVEEEIREEFKERLVKKSLDELEDYAILANKKVQEEKRDPVYNYLGMGGAPQSSEVKPRKVDILPLPTIDWAEAS